MDQHEITLVTKERIDCRLPRAALLPFLQDFGRLSGNFGLMRRTQRTPRRPLELQHLVHDAVALNGEGDRGYFGGGSLGTNNTCGRHFRRTLFYGNRQLAPSAAHQPSPPSVASPRTSRPSTLGSLQALTRLSPAASCTNQSCV